MYSEKREAIHNQLVQDLRNWFFTYVQTFKQGDSIQDLNIVLKEEHTKRVCREIVTIGEQLGLHDDELRLAEIIALFHDIGRFEQYARYKTFVDRRSENHAELGVAVLQRAGILNKCKDSTERLIIRAIRYHNRAGLPREETERCLFFSKLLRDADKLDIWRVVTDYYHRQEGKRNGTLELDLPDIPGFSEGVYRDLIHKRIVDMRHVNRLNDFKLLQIGWIFDINFDPTLHVVCSRRYLTMIRDVLPKSEKIDEIFSVIDSYLNERLKTSSR
jgi:putative nucleotidyltransferase with HDIG domain